MSNATWKEHAYPLKRITIELQGTRHSELASMIHELDEVKRKLLEGFTAGHHHDDDYGYKFLVSEAVDKSVFTTPAGLDFTK